MSGVIRRHSQSDHAAMRVPNHMGRCEAQACEQTGEFVHVVLHPALEFRSIAVAMSAAVV